MAHLRRNTDCHHFLLLTHPLTHTCQTGHTPRVPCARTPRTRGKDWDSEAQDTSVPRLIGRQDDLEIETFDTFALGDPGASEIAVRDYRVNGAA